MDYELAYSMFQQDMSGATTLEQRFRAACNVSKLFIGHDHKDITHTLLVRYYRDELMLPSYDIVFQQINILVQQKYDVETEPKTGFVKRCLRKCC